MGDNLRRDAIAWFEQYERRRQRRADALALLIGAALAVAAFVWLAP